MLTDPRLQLKSWIHISRLVSLTIASLFMGCALTPSVDTRKPGQRWYYYGDLLDLYRDQTRGVQIELVWLDQVQFQRVDPKDFQKVVQTYLGQGYRKIGLVSVRSARFGDPYEVKKLAADKGARLIVGFWVSNARVPWPMIDYYYQLLDKPSAPRPVQVPVPPLPLPVRTPPRPFLQ